MDPESLSRSTTPAASPKHLRNARSPIRDDTSTKSEELHSSSPDVISSPGFDITHESMLHRLSPTQLPPTQMMERSGDLGFNHSRIPSSVFASKPSTPVDWSLASNESLFSIRINNNSYREQANNLANDVIVSGELMKSGDLTRFMVSSTPVVSKRDMDNSDVESESGLAVSQSGLDDPEKGVHWETQVENNVEEKVPSQGDGWESSPLTNQPFGKISDQSSANPKKKSGWSLCSCLECTLPSCWSCNKLSLPSCTWPSCSSCKLSCCSSCKKKLSFPSCKWPSCSSCKLSSCCPSKKLSFPSCKWPSCCCCKKLSCPSGKWPSCGSCKWSCSQFKFPSCKCSCWNDCWAFLCCLNCKSKRICCCDSYSLELGAPTKAIVREKLDSIKSTPPSKRWCWIFPRFSCSGSWSWSCRCC